MKSILLLCLMFFTLGFSKLHAQIPIIDDQQNYETRILANKIGLNEFGYIRLKKLNLKKAAETQAILAEYGYDPSLKCKKLAEMEKNYDLQLRAFLRLKQLETYLALKEDLSKMIAQESNKK